MEQILLNTHKQNIEYIAGRFPTDIMRFQESEELSSGLQPATDFLAMGNVLMWVKNPNRKVVAAVSPNLYPDLNTNKILQEIPDFFLFPEVKTIHGRHFVFCSAPLIVQGENLGIVVIAQDITEEKTMFLALVRNLLLTSAFLLLLVIVGTTFYIRRALQPLRLLSRLAGEISPTNLHEAQLSLQTAPQEVHELAQAFNATLSRLSDTWEQQR